MTMIPVRRDQGVVVSGGGHTAHRYSFLTDVDVAESTDLLVLVSLHGPDLELADQVHVTQPTKKRFGWQRFGDGRMGKRRHGVTPFAIREIGSNRK